MTRYRCDICDLFEYDPERGNSVTGIRPETLPDDFPDDWRCPICSSDKTHLKLLPEHGPIEEVKQNFICPVCGATGVISISHHHKEDLSGYLGEWARESDDIEVTMQDIHTIASTGESIIEPMRTRKSVISWDDILIKGAQIARIPLNSDVIVNTRTIIGPDAKHPMILKIPIYVTHMSFGALSREIKMALAQGSAAVGTAIGSGEGGILPEARQRAYKYILEYVPNQYSITEENLRSVDAIEIKLGQSAEPGLGARLPAEKVTPEIAQVRGYPEGIDIISPASYPDIRSPEDLKEKVRWLREVSDGKPIGVKIAAGDIEEDLEAILFAEPDFITIDGRPGATGAAPKSVKDATSIPTIFALCRARKYLDSQNAHGISLVITGGLRTSADFAKALALGADAVAIGTAALMAAACQQYRICTTGKCPVGVTTQNQQLRERLKMDISAKKLENFLQVSTEELKDFARLTGNDDVHALGINNLCTTHSEISNHTEIRHV